MTLTEERKQAVLQGGELSGQEALELYEAPLEELCAAADEIRRHYCGNGFDLCSIINGKSGRCSENCKFCAQSAFYQTEAEIFPLRSTDEIVQQAKRDADSGVLRFSIVTSGKALNDAELDAMCEAIRGIRSQAKIEVCASFGLLTEEQYCRVKAAGAIRVHNNLETSKRYFPKVCTTHQFDEKVEAIRAATRAGLSVCSGGIIGIGETSEDRIDMALTLRELGIKSVPVNMLNPIPGTPCADYPPLTTEEMRRIVAVYRFLLPDASIRLAGGRGLLEDKGRVCFLSGANAAITGDMLTTSGYSAKTDLQLLSELGYTPALQN